MKSTLPSRFGFPSLPFTREFRVADRFAHELYERPREDLLRAVDQRRSAALIAPAGTGKTTLLRTLMDALPESRYRVRYVKVTDLSKRDLCREIATAVGVEPAGTYPTLVRRLQERFTHDREVDAVRPVRFLDESHGRRPEVLSLLRILTHFEMDSRWVLSFGLAGQPPLTRLLRDERRVDVTHRLAPCATLRPLSRQETGDYIGHRCRIAGSTRVPFEGGAMPALYEIGRGPRRATDHWALPALERAHDASGEVVAAQPVTEARRRLGP